MSVFERSPETSGGARAAGVLLWAGWALVVGCALLRAQSSLVPFPYWDIDPTMASDAILGFGPAGSVLIDVLMMLGAGVGMLGFALGQACRRAIRQASRQAGGLAEGAPGEGVRIQRGATVLLVFGAAGASLLAWLHLDWLERGNTVEDIRITSGWVAAVLAGLAMVHLCSHERVRRLTFALGIGFVVMLAAKGALQVFVEHPMTVQRFRMDPEGFLAAQGWPVDSAAARGFERRLTQPEATGWFAMANVYASFAAAGLVALVGLAVLAWRESRVKGMLPDGWAGLLTFGAIAGAAALVLAGGKGGFAAAGLGIGMLGLGAAAWKLRARSAADGVGRMRGNGWMRLGGVLALGSVAAALGAVVARGAIGERIGELSLLFRWFYMQGAARIFAENPLMGVGPAGFKDAYLLAKPPLSPEEIASPHSILFDWAATLGVAGLALGAAWLLWVWMAGVTGARSIVESRVSVPEQLTTETDIRGSFNSTEERIDARVVLLIAAGTMLLSAWLEQPGMTVEAAGMRLVGAAGWIGVAVAALAVMRATPWWWVGLASALTLAAHAQIELTPVWPGSAALFMVLIAVIAAPGGQRGTGLRETGPAEQDRGGSQRSWLHFAPAVCVLALAVSWPWLGLLPVARWQGDLRTAAAAVEPVAEIRQRLARLDERGMTMDGDSIERIATDVASMLGQRPPQSQAAFARDMNELLARTAIGAQDHLESAVERSRGHVQTTESLVRIMMLRAIAEWSLERHDRSREIAVEAEEVARAAAAAKPSAGAFGLLGNVIIERVQLENHPELRDRAIEAWTRAAELDPHGLTFPWRIYRALERDGESQSEAGQAWGRRVLELDEMLRLDEVKRLTPAERERVRRVVIE